MSAKLSLGSMVAFPSRCPRHPCHSNELEGRRMRRMSLLAELFHLFTSLMPYFACIFFKLSILLLRLSSSLLLQRDGRYSDSEAFQTMLIRVQYCHIVVVLSICLPEVHNSSPRTFFSVFVTLTSSGKREEAFRTIFPCGCRLLVLAMPSLSLHPPRKPIISRHALASL